MNVMISANDNYVDKAESMLLSLRNNCNQEITLYLINHSLSDKSLEHLSQFLYKNCDIRLINIPINHTVFDELPIVFPNLFSIEIFYRIVENCSSKMYTIFIKLISSTLSIYPMKYK